MCISLSSILDGSASLMDLRDDIEKGLGDANLHIIQQTHAGCMKRVAALEAWRTNALAILVAIDALAESAADVECSV